MSSEKELVRVGVLCFNSLGEPELHSCAVEVTEQERRDGVHYDMAKENAMFNAYENPMIAFDGSDPAATHGVDTLAWLTRAGIDDAEHGNLMPQCVPVQALIVAATAALPYLPRLVWMQVRGALTRFEAVSSVTTWCIEDVDEDDQYDMTDAERREVVALYARNYAPLEDELMYLARCTRQVVEKRHEAV